MSGAIPPFPLYNTPSVKAQGLQLHPFIPSKQDAGEWPVSRPGRFTPGKESPVSIGEKVGWAPEPVWMWSRN
jgi:hypothetical protein